MSTLGKVGQGQSASVSFAVGASGESGSSVGAALVLLAIALLALAAMPFSGMATSRTAPMLMVVSATALGVSGRRIAPAPDAAEARSGDSAYRALASSAGGIVALMTADGRALDVLAHDAADFGHAAHDLIGQGYYDNVHIADRPSFLQALSEAAHGEAAKAVVIRFRRHASIAASGDLHAPSYAHAEVRCCAIGGKSGKAQGRNVVSITRSVSDVYDLEANLASARREAQLAKTLKDRLLANVSHELRTPLNAILGFSEILGNETLAPTDPGKRMEYARIIHSSADHLLSVVNLVLDMSRIEAGKFDIEPETFGVEPLIKDCCDMLRLKAENGKVSLIQDPVGGGLELTADKRACRQILLNLLSNAVKFTLPTGSVAVGAKREGDEIHLYVSDTGIGIDSDHLQGLGSPFYQVRSSYNRAFEGAGLGLSLVRGLVGLHGGSMLLETEPGVGTRVTARLPVDCRLVGAKASNATNMVTMSTLSPLEAAAPVSAASAKGERRFA